MRSSVSTLILVLQYDKWRRSPTKTIVPFATLACLPNMTPQEGRNALNRTKHLINPMGSAFIVPPMFAIPSQDVS